MSLLVLFRWSSLAATLANSASTCLLVVVTSTVCSDLISNFIKGMNHIYRWFCRCDLMLWWTHHKQASGFEAKELQGAVLRVETNFRADSECSFLHMD
ncbi:hypothetical protein CY34DRAFT_812374 [Suillus luteus UH-Slu-Lm8-n1]|uniref:Secreted protein n=1 Tax=Suillus luteus UH-Slu-Lm8-n1 TaxID=930992 RepID=A0A0D0AAL5_9AGAM|nr:hypothetical protein CY34DRAFT_812374 [Suillus luteus UH-Slu-Lm8-n1]